MLVRIRRLPSVAQLAFGCACCQRLLPNFFAFEQATGWGEVAVLRNAVEYVWNLLPFGVAEANQVHQHIERCEALAPRSDDFDSLLVTAAQDVCFSVCSLLDFVLHGDPKSIVQIATYATDSIDLFVQETENMAPGASDLEHRILMNPLMQKELKRQEADLVLLENTPLTDVVIGKLKDVRDYDGLGNLGV